MLRNAGRESRPGDPRSKAETRALCRARQRAHIDRKAVFHVAAQHPLIGFVDLLNGDDFHVRDYLMLGAEIEHLLRLGYAADQRTSKIAAFEDEAEDFDRHGLFGGADLG